MNLRRACRLAERRAGLMHVSRPDERRRSDGAGGREGTGFTGTNWTRVSDWNRTNKDGRRVSNYCSKFLTFHNLLTQRGRGL